jgi:bleomycin hydrolase
MLSVRRPWMSVAIITIALALTAPGPLVGQDGKGAITHDLIGAFRASMEKDPRLAAVKNAVSGNEIKSLVLNRQAANAHNNQYTNRIKTGDITNQKGSGRCWLFAGLNILRPAVMKKYNLGGFELSQNYSFFWDKLEKANLFLEGIIGTLDKDLDDRTVRYLLENPIEDGGQWNMVVDLLEKYGVVPASVMPDTKHSSGTGEINDLLGKLLRRDAAELRRLRAEGKVPEVLRERKLAMLFDVYRILSYAFGEPPATFRWRYQDKDEKLGEMKEYTPRQFYKEFIGIDLSQYVCLYDCPAHPYGKLYRIQFDRDLHDRPDMTFANVPIAAIKEAVLKQVLEGEPVWFGCDVGQEHGPSGILQTGIFDYTGLLGVDFGMTKEERIRYRESIPSHAMVFLGVDLDAGKPVKWLVENSWGADKGDKGFLAMYDRWFEEYLYAAILHRKHLKEDVLKVFGQEPETLPPWDPMYDLVR